MTTSPSRSPQLLVVGCGGIGGVVMAGLLEQGQRVTAVAKRPEITVALAQHGVRISDEHGTRAVRGELTALTDQLREVAAHLARPPIDGPCDAHCACLTLDRAGARVELTTKANGR